MPRVLRPQLLVLTDEAAGSCDGALGPAASPRRPPWAQPPRTCLQAACRWRPPPGEACEPRDSRLLAQRQGPPPHLPRRLSGGPGAGQA